MSNNEISDITFNIKPNGEVFPENEIDINERVLRGFVWRLNEKPENKNDLFSLTDKNLILPKIYGIQVPDKFNSELDSPNER